MVISASLANIKGHDWALCLSFTLSFFQFSVAVAMSSRRYANSVPKCEGRAPEPRKFVLRTLMCFVTWSQSCIHDYCLFYQKLWQIMPRSTKIFSGKELYQDGNPHYHAVMRFPYKVYWKDARKKLMITGSDGDIDTRAIRIVVPDEMESVSDFLRRTQAYCAKDGNPWLFGDRFGVVAAREESADVSVDGPVFGETRYCAECSRVFGVGVVCFCTSCVEKIWQVRVSAVFMLRSLRWCALRCCVEARPLDGARVS